MSVMNGKKMMLFLLLVFGCVVTIDSNAQMQTSPWSIGISGGTLVYQGDLVPTTTGNLKTLKPAIGVHITREINEYFSIRTNLLFGKVSSDEARYTTPSWRPKRAFKFSTPVTELSGLLMFEPMGHYDGYGSRIRPYVFGGLGVTLLNISRDYSRFDTTVFNKNTSAYTGLVLDTLQTPPRILATLPLGGGLQYHFNTQWSVFGEAVLRLTASDYLDGFKYAANPKNNDRYYGISIGLNYKFGGYKCPAVR